MSLHLASVMFGRKPFCRGRVKKFGLMSFFSPHCVYSLVTNDWSVAHFTQSALNARPSALPADVGQTRFWPSWKQNGEITIHPETEKLLQIWLKCETFVSPFLDGLVGSYSSFGACCLFGHKPFSKTVHSLEICQETFCVEWKHSFNNRGSSPVEKTVFWNEKGRRCCVI